MTLTEKLNQLAEFMAAKQAAELSKQELIDQVLTPEIRAKVAEIEAEFQNGVEAVNAKIAQLEAEIRAEVIQTGASVRGEYLQAVYSKPRATWDGKLLEGYLMAHPEIAQARKFGEPSVSIRKVG